MMKRLIWTRRNFLVKGLGVFLSAFFSSLWERLVSVSWAKVKQLLPKGFPKEQLIHLDPGDLDTRNLEIDPLEKFGTMGPTDIAIDPATYRLKLAGKVETPLSLSMDQIKQFPPVTEVVLLICPGVFANNGRWTGVPVKILLEETKAKKGAQSVVIKGAEKAVQVPLEELHHKKILLAYQVNDATLPRKHGFPLRLVLEGHYGYEWVKYVDEIEVL
jgi:DMSO/TMAO reductase YedYZ molybdopterin-dependent catalytic subunit